MIHQDSNEAPEQQATGEKETREASRPSQRNKITTDAEWNQFLGVSSSNLQSLGGDQHKSAESPPSHSHTKPPSPAPSSHATTMAVFITDVSSFRANNQNYLFLFGILEEDKRVTICVTQLKRTLYFVLRPGALESDAQQEIDLFLKINVVKTFQSRFVTMKYVFELKDMPRGDVRVYEVRFPFEEEQELPSPAVQGYTYKYVIGTSYTPLETFLIRNGIQGPQWINIPRTSLKSASELSSRSVWGNSQLFELFLPETIDASPKNPPPAIRVISISLKACKPKDLPKHLPNNRQSSNFQIYTLSYIFCPQYSLQSREPLKPTEAVCYYINTLIKPPLKSDVFKYKEVLNESQMLSHFVNRLSFLDPDVVVCHDSSKNLDLITARLCIDRISEMKRMGRLKCTEDVSVWKGPVQRLNTLCRGRVIVDTLKHAEEAIKSNDYKLSTLSKQMALKALPELDYQQEIKMVERGELNKLSIHTHDESFNTLDLMARLQILQSTLKLAHICGYIWQKVINQCRSERNEYLIMHECYKQGYLIPDKFYSEDDSVANKYEGGRVLEPKRGLHPGYTVLLDFVSLYPSIIREYNICFSKVKRNLLPLSHYVKMKFNPKEEEDRIIDVEPLDPEDCSEENWGLLPRMIHYIVTEREKYKALMKTAPEKDKAFYNSTQKAYKLVANSIYGCLGFEKSRFYARDLASLITRLGRQTLLSAQKIIEGWTEEGDKLYDILYGDTDSLMIKVNLRTTGTPREMIREIARITKETTNQINSHYRVIRMEMDGLFDSVLLAAKKKYAGNKLTNMGGVVDRASMEEEVEPVFKVEYKGVEGIRGDSSALLKEISVEVFRILFQSSKSLVEIAIQLYDYFKGLCWRVNSDDFSSYGKYVLVKTLNKHPVLYKNDRGLHHVIVAKELIKQGHRLDSLIHHSIEYLMVRTQLSTQPVGVNQYIKSQESPSPLQIDKEYYKQHEILPPVRRILAEIQDVDFEVIRCNLLGVERGQRETTNRHSEENKYMSVSVEANEAMVEVDSRFHELFGFVKCPSCGKNYRTVRNGVFTAHCQESKCEYFSKSFLHLSVNKMFLYLFTESCKFYATRPVCAKCNVESELCVRQCRCHSHKFSLQNTLSQIHDNIYLFRRTTLSNLQANRQCSVLQSVLIKLDEWQSLSSYQTISGDLFTRLKHRR